MSFCLLTGKFVSYIIEICDQNMACILLYSGKRSLIRDMSCNPSKKIKLDSQNKNDGSAVNEDLWGQDDLTAEEFDMLEIQATQSCNQTIAFPSHNAHQVNQVPSSTQKDMTWTLDQKLLQYELEGRIKLLSQSLEKSTKELNEERLNREKIINNRMKEFQMRELNLQKEVEKMQSILDFKEQEMKSISSKLQILKSQIPVKKISSDETSVNKNFDGFLNSCKPFDNKVSAVKYTKNFHRKHKLLVDAPWGETGSTDILSSILCNRLIPAYSAAETPLNFECSKDNLRKGSLSSMSVVQLKSGKKSYELLEYYRCVLTNHVMYLKHLASKSNSSSKHSPFSVHQKEASSQAVTSCLRDIMYLYCSSKLKPVIQKTCDTSESSVVNNMGNVSPKESEEESSPQGQVIKENNAWDFSAVLNTTTNDFSLILESLLSLVNPSIFPKEYPKNEEIELSLTSLLTICSSYPEEFLDHVSELPVYSLLSSDPSISVVCTTLKVLHVLSSCKNFTLHLTHKENNCLWCSVSSLLCNIIPCNLEGFSISMILVEDFLSSVFSLHNIPVILTETVHCISKVIQGFIVSIWKYLQLKKQCCYKVAIIKKGFLLLHFMSNNIPNFKQHRNPVEHEYISFISSLLTLSKENLEFKDYYDLIHDLWDFQTDISEFDLEDPTDETLTSTNEMDVEE